MRALLIGNGDDLDPGFVGHRLREHGYAFVECHREHPDEWPALERVDLVLTLGSEWNVYRSETADLVAAEAALVRAVVERNVPLLGLCFGAQVVSHALGGTVSRAPAPEIGWYELEMEPGPSVDGLARGPWLMWHFDVFTVPDGYAAPAWTAAGPQLLHGGRTLATQFHPEVTESMVSRWLAMGGADQLRQHGADPDELLAETRDNVARSAPNAAALVDRFLTDVAASPPPGSVS
jgi:GMP synthase-like glutamine amidotransferase